MGNKHRPRHMALVGAMASVVLASPLIVTPSPAFAYTGSIAGDAACPGGALNAGSWASNLCLTNVGSKGIIGTVNAGTQAPGPQVGSDVKQKVSLYSGSPCSYVSEGGDIAYQDGNNSVVHGFYWQNNDSVYGNRLFINPDGPEPGNVPISVTYDGGTTFSVYVNNKDVSDDPYEGHGACIAETGMYSQSSNGLSSITESGASTTTVEIEELSGAFVTKFSDYRIDNPCGIFGNTSPNCLNGAFINSSTGWGDNRG